LIDDNKTVSGLWGEKMATLDAALGLPNSQSRHNWHYERSLNRRFTEKFIAGLIGEKEGRKWLKEQGYDVFEFGMVERYFEKLKETSERLLKRRKQVYIEQDKTIIKLIEDMLRDFFGNKFEEAEGFFFEFVPKRKEIWRLRGASGYRGGIGPDFIVKKEDFLYLIEVKANTAKLAIYQKMCFELAKKHSIKSLVLNVAVESRKVKKNETIGILNHSRFLRSERLPFNFQFPEIGNHR
jgi:hypothetical protein